MTRLTFDILITLLSASFEDVLQGFGTQVDVCSSRSGFLSGHRTWPQTSADLSSRFSILFLFLCLAILLFAVFVVIKKLTLTFIQIDYLYHLLIV